MSNNNNKNSLTSRTYSTGFQSPEFSPYSEHVGGRPAGLGAPKAWCSERVPLSNNKTRRHVAASALMPFTSGRTLPSKWDDAERWISSPVSAGNVTYNNYNNNFHHHHGGGGFARTTSHLVHHNHNSYYSQRRAKSKSGPLGPAGLLSYGSLNSYSPVLGMGVIHGGQWRNSVTIDSPADMGPARFEDALVGNCDQGSRKSCPGDPDWLDLWSGPLIHTHQDIEKENTNKEDEETHNQSGNDEVGVDRIISRRDMSTQMHFVEGEMMSSSHYCSTVSSPKSMISTSYSPHPQQLDHDDDVCENANQSPESQVKDVQVDEHIIISTTPLSNLDKHYNFSDSPSNSTASITHTKFSKEEREEVRIRAWEDLQKAKAEAAIQKLEMELEKKRSSSMEKIAEKLKKVEIKAEKMRSSVCKGDDGQIQRHTTRSFSKLPSFCKKLGFGCYPF